MGEKVDYYTKIFKKNATSVATEFVASSDFFINQFATNEQLHSFHYGILDLDVIHTINNCKSHHKTTCKQTLYSLIYLHNYYDLLEDITPDIGDANKDDIYKEKFDFLIDSYFVGEYHYEELVKDLSFIVSPSKEDKKIRPIFLTKQGIFRDYKGRKYQPDYIYNIKNKRQIQLPPSYSPENTQRLLKYFYKLSLDKEKNKDLIIRLTNFLDRIQRTHYRFIHNTSFVLRNCYPGIKDKIYNSQQSLNDFSLSKYISNLSNIYQMENLTLSKPQREKIITNVFDISLLEKALKIMKDKPDLKDTINDNNKIIVGVSEYSRNYYNGEIKLIFLDGDGNFIDDQKCYYWPLYETCLYKIYVKDEELNYIEKTFSMYSFARILSNDPSNDINSLYGRCGFTNNLIIDNYYFNNPNLGFLRRAGTGTIEFIKYITILPYTIVDLSWLKNTVTNFANWGFFSNNENFIENERKQHIKQNKEDSELQEDSGMIEAKYIENSKPVNGGSPETFTSKELNELKENLLEYLEIREKVINDDFAIKEFMKKESIVKKLEILLPYYKNLINKELDELINKYSDSTFPDIGELTLTNSETLFMNKYNDININLLSQLDDKKIQIIIENIKTSVCTEEAFNKIITEKNNFDKYFLPSFEKKTTDNEILQSIYGKNDDYTQEEQQFIVNLNVEASKKSTENINSFSNTSNKIKQEIGYIMSQQLLSNLKNSLNLKKEILKQIEELPNKRKGSQELLDYKEEIMKSINNEQTQLTISKETFSKINIIAK